MDNDTIKETIFGLKDDSLLYKNMEAQKITRKMLNESIESLKIWYYAQPHFPKIELEDRFLIGVLCSNNYSLERSKIKIDNILAARSLTPEFFKDRSPWSESTIKSMKNVYWVLIPKLLQEKYRIVLFRLRSSDLEDYNFADSLTVAFMGADMRVMYESCFNDIIIWDGYGLKTGHALKIHPNIIKKAIFVFQNCYSSKIKSFHVVNLPKYFNSIGKVLKSSMKKKIGERVHFHNSIEDLAKMIPLDYLPNELGGCAGSYADMSAAYRSAMQSEEWTRRLQESGNQKSNESLRSEKKDIFNEILGITGSFRTLDID